MTTKNAAANKVAKKRAPQPKPSAPGRMTIARLELTPDAKGQVLEVSERLGMTQIAALSRLVEWFAGQSPEVQAAVNDGKDAARPILERMANGTE